MVADSLAGDPGDRYEIVMTNPPFGKKSSTTIVADDGKVARETEIIERDDFWATTSNKQLNFLQHVKTPLKQKGRAAIVVPDNVLFEAAPARPSAASCCTSARFTPYCVCRPACFMLKVSKPTFFSSTRDRPVKRRGRRNSGSTIYGRTSTSR